MKRGSNIRGVARAAALCALSLTVIFGTLVPAQAHSKRYDTTTSIKLSGVSGGYGDAPDESGTISGKVKSEKDACVEERKVVVYSNRTDEKVGEDVTGGNGGWSVSVTDPKGSYHAEVKKRTLKKDKKHSHVCQSTSSGNVSAP